MSWPLGTPVRLRVLLNATNDPASTAYQLEHKVGNGSYRATGTSSSAAVYIYTSANIAASAATSTTSQLTGGTGTFTAGRISDDTNPLPSIDIVSDGNTELEWCIMLNQAYLPGGVTVSFRVTKSGVPLDTYTQTPTLVSGGHTVAWLRA